MTDIMREWNEALTAPKCEHGHLAPVCDLCKKDAEIAQLRAAITEALRMMGNWPEGAEATLQDALKGTT